MFHLSHCLTLSWATILKSGEDLVDEADHEVLDDLSDVWGVQSGAGIQSKWSQVWWWGPQLEEETANGGQALLRLCQKINRVLTSSEVNMSLLCKSFASLFQLWNIVTVWEKKQFMNNWKESWKIFPQITFTIIQILC